MEVGSDVSATVVVAPVRATATTPPAAAALATAPAAANLATRVEISTWGLFREVRAGRPAVPPDRSWVGTRRPVASSSARAAFGRPGAVALARTASVNAARPCAPAGTGRPARQA